MNENPGAELGLVVDRVTGAVHATLSGGRMSETGKPCVQACNSVKSPLSGCSRSSGAPGAREAPLVASI